MNTQALITSIYMDVMDKIKDLTEQERTEVIQGLYEEFDSWLDKYGSSEEDSENTLQRTCHICMCATHTRIGPASEDSDYYKCNGCGNQITV